MDGKHTDLVPWEVCRLCALCPNSGGFSHCPRELGLSPVFVLSCPSRSNSNSQAVGRAPFGSWLQGTSPRSGLGVWGGDMVRDMCVSWCIIFKYINLWYSALGHLYAFALHMAMNIMHSAGIVCYCPGVAVFLYFDFPWSFPPILMNSLLPLILVTHLRLP